MRPEIKEYNYDWLMGNTLNAASKISNGTPKEIDLTYQYIPTYKNVVKTFVDAEEPGLQIFKLFAKYYENILTAREQGKKLVATTFCFSPGICYAMDIVPICMEMLTALGNIVWQRGMAEYLDYACQVGLPETSCSSQRGPMGP